jgi:antitoxin ParD1/3/4
MLVPTRNVVLTAQQQTMIEELVASGRYQNASEVLREGLRLVEQREAEDAARLEALRAAAREGVVAIERGDAETFETAAELADFISKIGTAAIKDAVGG